MNRDFYLACLQLGIVLLMIFWVYNKKVALWWKNGRIARKLSGFWDEKDERLFAMAFVITLILGTGVRVYRFGAVPSGLNQDGAMAAVDAYALAMHGTDRFGMRFPVHFTAWGYGQMSVLYSYLLAPLFKVGLPLNELVTRIPALVVSMCGWIVLYLYTEKVAGRWTALTVFFFGAICPWHIMQSRWALDCNMLPHFLLFGMYFLVLGLEKRRWLYVSMVFFALCMYAYGLAFYAVPLLLVLLCAYLLYKRSVSWKNALICAGIYFFFSWPIFGVMLINFFGWESLSLPWMTIPYFPDSVRTGDLLFFSQNMLSQFRENALSFVKVALLQEDGLPWNRIEGFGTIYLCSIPLVIIGICHEVRRWRKEKSVGAALMLLWLMVSVISGLIVNGANINRMNQLFYPLIFFGGMGIASLVRRMKETAAVVAALYLTLFFSFSGAYFGPHDRANAYWFYSGFGDALRKVEQVDYEKIYITTDLCYENYGHVAQILTMFYHQTDAEYFQGKTNVDGKRGETLPYQEKYHFVDFERTAVLGQEDAVYILNNDELALFETGEYDLYTYEFYSAAVPKR